MIELRNVSKQYKTHVGGLTDALHNINLDVKDGEFVSLIGPSGCGKTTLLKILAGLEDDYEGTAVLNGNPVTKPSSDIGMVFQDPTLLPWRTILSNILLPIELRRLDKEFYVEKALELMNMMGLKGFDDKYPRELSGGMRQRASICRALIHDPKVLLMDEPFAALDAMTRDFLNEELQKIWLKSGKTVVFVTHSIAEAVFLSDRIVVMTPRPGEIAEIVPITIPRERKRADMACREPAEALLHIRERFAKLNNRLYEDAAKASIL